MYVEGPRRLAVCADDYGLAASVNQAVLALAQQGRISATSCMVGGPHWTAGAAALRACEPDTLAVGLHLDLTRFPRNPRLRLPLQQWLLRSHLRLLPRAEVRQEIETQLAAFEQAMERPPTHVDGHEHVHQLPVVREELLAALQARYGGQLPRLRCTRRPAGETWGSKAWVIETVGGAGLARLASAKGYEQNGHLLGVYDFQGDAERYLALLGHWLKVAEDGDLLMCHPATAMIQGDSHAGARVREYQVLAAPAFGALLAREGIRVRR
jgi:predicted glycoside hydrolase/deacetylase ChbG (UPF0249 family)